MTRFRRYARFDRAMAECLLLRGLCCKSRRLFAAGLDLSVDQIVGFPLRACNSVTETYAAQGIVGDGGGRQRNLTRRRRF